MDGTFSGQVGAAVGEGALADAVSPILVAQAATPGQAVQQGAGLGEPIGQVSEAAGEVTARHADGTEAVLTNGSPIFQGDVLQTGGGAHVGVVFVDDTVFSLDENGRMVLDEMVYDPDTQSGTFSAQVAQGVFSFVSGQVAKTSPEGMMVQTPTATIGIRGSTVVGNAAPEGAESKITLVRDVDGNVGEIIISTGAGTLVLNQAGATTAVFSANAAPTPPVFLSPLEIQQNFGNALTKLTQVVAQKAEADAAKAEEEAQKTGEEAKQADAEAKQADDAAQKADAEAEAAQAAAEAAKAEAEATGSEEAKAKAQAAEAKVAEAEARAEAAKAAAEAKAQEAAAKAAEAAKAEAQAAKAAEFNTLTKTAITAQVRAFEEVTKFTDLQQSTAAKAATAVTVQPGENKGRDEAASTAHAEAVVKAQADAEAAAKVAARAMADVMARVLAEAEQIREAVREVVREVIPVTTETRSVETAHGETITAPATDSAMTGTAKDTNFYFPWPSVSGIYTVADAGGANQIAIDNLDDVWVSVIVDAYTSTSGDISFWNAGFGKIANEVPVATIAFSDISQFLVSDISVPSFATTDYATVQNRAGDILALESLGAGKVHYVLAGTDAANTFDISENYDSNIIFGKGGGDTFKFWSTVTKNATVIGGSTSTDNVDGNADGIPDSYLNLFDYHYMTEYTAGSNGIVARLEANDATVNDSTTYFDGIEGNDLFKHNLWDIGMFVGSNGDDTINVVSGGYKSISGGDGDDTFTVKGDVLSSVSTFDGGAGSDTLVVEISSGGSFAINPDGVGNFEAVTLNASGSTGAVNLTAAAVTTTMTGSSYDDVLTGGYVSDGLTGGAGADVFVYNSVGDGATAWGDLLYDFSGATQFGGGAGQGDTFQLLDTAFGISSIGYEEVAWDGTATALNLTNTAANIIVLTGGIAGTAANAFAALAAGNALSTDALVVFNISDVSNYGTIYHTTNLDSGAGATNAVASFFNQTGDMAALSAADFSIETTLV